MKFWALKWLVENVLRSYRCSECSCEVNEENIDVIWAAWNTVNIDIECSNCGKHSMIKSEVLTLDLSNMNITKEKLWNIKAELWKIQGKINLKKDSIKDELIINLNKSLKQEKMNVSDLFWSDEK